MIFKHEILDGELIHKLSILLSSYSLIGYSSHIEKSKCTLYKTNLECIFDNSRKVCIHEIVFPLNTIWIEVKYFHHIDLFSGHPQSFSICIIKAAT